MAVRCQTGSSWLIGPLWTGEYRGSRSGSTEFRIWAAAPLVRVEQFYSQRPRGCCPGAGGGRRESRWGVPSLGFDFEGRRTASRAGRS